MASIVQLDLISGKSAKAIFFSQLYHGPSLPLCLYVSATFCVIAFCRVVKIVKKQTSQIQIRHRSSQTARAPYMRRPRPSFQGQTFDTLVHLRISRKFCDRFGRCYHCHGIGCTICALSIGMFGLDPLQRSRTFGR